MILSSLLVFFNMRIIYTEDILGDSFEQRAITLNDDYEGKVISVLVRRRSEVFTDKAVLYIHGFNDYFFQKELAYQFNDRHISFYALDLRKYGRSYLPHQKFNDIRDLRSYYEEILEAINIIKEEGYTDISLMGHSTGGLILTLFAKDYSGSDLFQNIILNSPFYDFNLPFLLKQMIPIVSGLGKIWSSTKIKGGFTEEYGKSIHRNYNGEWDYNLNWKPNVAPKVNLGWIRAIYQGQKELRKPFFIQQPVLVLHSSQSLTDKNDKSQLQTRDIILDVADIDKIARNIRDNIQIKSIEGGLHDLILSKKSVRDEVYSIIFDWLKTVDM